MTRKKCQYCNSIEVSVKIIESTLKRKVQNGGTTDNEQKGNKSFKST